MLSLTVACLFVCFVCLSVNERYRSMFKLAMYNLISTHVDGKCD